MIPKQLITYRFIKTNRKIAIEAGWPIDPTRFKKQPDNTYFDKINNITYKSKGKPYIGSMTSYDANEPTLTLHHNATSKTYGVLGGYNGLIIIDVDDKHIAKTLLDKPPFSETFTVLSGSKKLPHFYFKCEDYSPTVRYDNNNGKRILDVQGASTFVIGPNSEILSNNIIQKYEISNDIEILKIPYKELLNFIEEYIGDTIKIQKKEKNPYNEKYTDIDPIMEEIFKKIDCTTLLDEHNINIESNPGDTPFAESTGKKCLHRSKHLWFDHHTQQGGNVIHLYAKLNKIEFIQAKYELAERVGVTDEVFQQAMQFFAKKRQAEMIELLTTKFLLSNHIMTARVDGNYKIYIYIDGIYEPHGKSYIIEFCDKIMTTWSSMNITVKVIDKIIARTFVNDNKLFEEADTKYIPVQNGILNIFTKELIDFSPNFKFFYKLPVVYDPSKTCETTQKHYQEVLNGEQDIKVMQELYGYFLYRDYKFEKAFIFYGNGRNGKGKSMEQMWHLLGKDNICNMSLHTLQKEKFMRVNLHKKMANLAGDIGRTKLDETQIFKELTGHDYITVDRKNDSTISFTNYAKMVFAANEMPDTSDDSDGFWDRWQTLGFTKKFLLQTDYDLLKSRGKLESHHRLADINIIEKLTTPQELSGVLNWGLDGLKRLLAQGGFSVSNSAEEVKQWWKRKVSSAIAFKQDKIKVTYNHEDFVVADDLYKAYNKYCMINKLKPESVLEFKKMLQNNGLTCERKSVSYGKEYRWYYITMEE